MSVLAAKQEGIVGDLLMKKFQVLLRLSKKLAPSISSFLIFVFINLTENHI